MSIVEGCEAAGIMVVRDGDVVTLASTHNIARASDRMQGEVGEGPCFDVQKDAERVYRIDDMSGDVAQWPTYAARAREMGIGSMMGFLLFTDTDSLGALDMYSSRPKAFSGASEQAGLLLASHAAVAFAGARNEAQLREAISTRQAIGAALGIVMERTKLDEEQAFRVLAQTSQNRNVKVRDLADHIVLTGEIPD